MHALSTYVSIMMHNTEIYPRMRACMSFYDCDHYIAKSVSTPLNVDEVLKKKNLSFVGGIKETFGFKPFRELIGIMLFSWLGLLVIH